ncbi:hypothetical protein G6F68_015335 [Rhizopus microsporus]|nr:hypothetical protein G6F68_015335 [Rhizopus microsporus]
MRNYSIYTCSVTIRIVVGFSILIWAFQFDFPPFMVLIIAMLNDGTIMTISKDRVRPSPYPDAWNLREIFSYAIVYGLYLTASTVGLVAVCLKTDFFNPPLYCLPPSFHHLSRFDFHHSFSWLVFYRTSLHLACLFFHHCSIGRYLHCCLCQLGLYSN